MEKKKKVCVCVIKQDVDTEKKVLQNATITT